MCAPVLKCHQLQGAGDLSPGPPLGALPPDPPLWARAPSLAIAAHPSAPPTSNYFRRPAAARWRQPYAHKYYHRSLHPPILTVVYLDYTRASRFYIYSVHLFSGIRHTHSRHAARAVTELNTKTRGTISCTRYCLKLIFYIFYFVFCTFLFFFVPCGRLRRLFSAY